jgi:hypothetical protein
MSGSEKTLSYNYVSYITTGNDFIVKASAFVISMTQKMKRVSTLNRPKFS